MSDQRDPDDALTPALRELGEHLRVAAHREHGAPARRRHRIPRRGLLLAAAVIVVSVGAATAADLISVGTPARNTLDIPARSGPNSRPWKIDVTAPDPGRRLPWAVATYKAKDGTDCVLFGQASLGRLGEVTGGEFHPYPHDHVGFCGHLDRAKMFFSTYPTADEPRRVLVIGRARPGIGFVTITEPGGKTHRVNTGPDGAFLAVFDGNVDDTLIRVMPLDEQQPKRP